MKILRLFAEKTMRVLTLLFVVLALFLSTQVTTLATTTNIYFFQQTGWASGGVLSGWFTAIGGSTGLIKHEYGQVFALEISLTGNSRISDFTLSSTNLPTFDLAYDLGGGAILGDYLYEGIRFNNYRSGPAYGGFSSGGIFTYDGFGILEGTPSPVTIYDIQPIPEPSIAVTLTCAGVLLMFIANRKRIARKN